MISYVDRSSDTDLFGQAINEYWERYTKGHYSEYPTYDISGLKAYLEANGDTEMLEYVNHLNNYLDICSDIRYNGWDYPDKEDLYKRDSVLNAMKTESEQYKGVHLRSQYSLLYARCNMLLGNWRAIKTHWENESRHHPQNVFRDMEENIYAGALYHLGERDAATEIYVRQGDEQSIRWSLRKHRNLAGIKSIYQHHPNSHSLYYLVQDFVNNVQETIDDEQDEEKIQWYGMRFISLAESQSFCLFADSVIAEGKTESPCMWATAQAMLYYLSNNLEKAKECADRAMTLDGNERIKANCRCVRLLIYSSSTSTANSWLLKELKWLEEMIDSETRDGYCYSNAYDRIICKSLSPMLRKKRQNALSTAVLGMYTEYKVRHTPRHERHPNYTTEYGEPTWNSDYSSEYMLEHIYSLSADACRDYYDYIRDSHSDPFVNYICSQTYKNSDFFNDLIGTKLIAEARFSEALPYLEKVSLAYLGKMNVSYYMYHRDFTKERWFVRQGTKDDLEGIGLVSFKSNPKVTFCRRILELQHAYSTHQNSEKGDAIAYQLGTMYYQASYKGECWWLTSYKNSIYTNTPEYNWENDFVSSAKVYLKTCCDSENNEIKEKSLYALAYIPTSPWAESDTEYDDEGEYTRYANPDPMSEQYSQLEILNRYYESHKETSPDYISHCDVLRQFRKLKWLLEY